MSCLAQLVLLILMGILLCYLSVLSVLLIGARILIMIFTIELLSWVFGFLLRREQVPKYLLLQAYFSLLGLLSLASSPWLLALALLLKIGLPPFHLWVLSFTQNLRKWGFVFFMTVHKAAPLIILMKILTQGVIGMLRISIIFFVRLILLHFREFVIVITLSSLSHRGWILLSGGLSLRLIFFYWALYRAILIMFFGQAVTKKPPFVWMWQASFTSVTLLLLSGFPPFTFFWVKIAVIFLLLEIRATFSWIITFSAVIALSAYYRLIQLRVRSGNRTKVSAISFFFVSAFSLGSF